MSKKALHIASRIVVLALLLIISVPVILQIPAVQKSAVDYAVSLLGDNFEAGIDIRTFHVNPVGALILEGVTVTDNHPYRDTTGTFSWDPADTLFHAEKISATFKLSTAIGRNGLQLGRVKIIDAVFHYVTEPGGELPGNLQRIFRLYPPEVPKEEGAVFHIRKVSMANVRFRLNSYLPPRMAVDRRSPDGIHYEDLDATVKYLRCRDLRFADGMMSGKLDRMAMEEKRGYAAGVNVKNFRVGRGRAEARDIHLKDKWSDINLPVVILSYKRHTHAFSRFIDDVHIETHLGRDGRIAMKTITGICGALDGNDAVVEVHKLNASGYVRDMDVQQLDFKELTTGITGNLKCRITGLPNILTTVFDGTVSNVKFTPPQASSFINFWSATKNLDFSGVAPETVFSMNGTVHGPLSDLQCDIRLKSPSDGNVTASAKLINVAVPGKIIEIKGDILSEDLDLGKIIGTESLGKADFSTSAELVLSDTLAVFVNKLDIDSLSLADRKVSGISFQGRYYDTQLFAQLSSTDPNLNFNLVADGSGTPERGNLNLQLSGDITGVNLQALNIDKRDLGSTVSASLRASVNLIRNNNLAGTVQVDDLRLENLDGSYVIDRIYADVISGSRSSINLSSDFLDVKYSGSKGFSEMVSELLDATARRELPVFYSDLQVPADSVRGKFILDMNVHDAGKIVPFINPELYIADNSRLTLNLDDGHLNAGITSPRLASGTNFIKDLAMDIDNKDGKIEALLKGGRLNVLGNGMSNGELTAVVDSNRFDIRIKVDTEDGTRQSGEILLDGELSRDENNVLAVNARTRKSAFLLGNQDWNISDSRIFFSDGELQVDNFTIGNGTQGISLNGGVSKVNKDVINLDLNGIGMELVDLVLGSQMGLAGTLSGTAKLISPVGERFLLGSKINCDSLSVKGTDAGSITIIGRWNDEKQAAEALVRNELNGHDAMDLIAAYSPSAKEIEADIKLDRMSPAIVAPFLSDLFSEMGGSVSGAVKVKGPLDAISISGEGTRLDSLRLGIAATGVTYILNGPLRIEDNKVGFDGISISDMAGGSGMIRGELTHNFLKDIQIDTKLDFSDLLMINADENYDKSLYGHLKASGNASVHGPVKNMLLKAKVATSGEGNVHVPLGASQTAITSDLLTFVEKPKVLDPYEEMMESRISAGKTEKGNVTIEAELTVNPEVRAMIEIDKSTGNVLTAQGKGDVNLFIKPSKGIFNIEGDYNISGGNFRLQTAAILGREFSIREGGFLKFNGDPLDSDIDVTAMYNLKTSLATLTADTTSISTRRLVQCGLHLYDKIRNPQVGFTIDIPDLDPTTKAKVESALNTEDKIQKQFVSLLLFGTFLPSEQSGVINGNNMLYSNVSELMSGQINSIFQKLDIPVDMGFGYQQDTGGTNIFDVAVSTQLFNNRVLVNGSVGNRKYRQSSSPYGDLVGDLDIEIKLDKSGMLRLKVFSHSADEFTSYLDFSQRNGIGLSFQREFDRLQDIFKSYRQIETEDIASQKDKQKVIIKIEKDD